MYKNRKKIIKKHRHLFFFQLLTGCTTYSDNFLTSKNIQKIDQINDSAYITEELILYKR